MNCTEVTYAAIVGYETIQRCGHNHYTYEAADRCGYARRNWHKMGKDCGGQWRHYRVIKEDHEGVTK